MASPPHPPPPGDHRHRRQRHQPPHLGAPHHGGAVGEARGAGSADDPEQHHGVDAAGVHGHHAQLPHRGPHVLRRLRRRRGRWPPPERAAGGWRRRRDGAVHQVLRHPRLLPRRLPPQRAVHPLLQPHQHPRQRAGAPPAPPPPGPRRRLRHRDAQPRQLLLVARRARLLLLVPRLPLALRAHPHVRRLRRHGLRALLPRRLRRLGGRRRRRAGAAQWKRE